MARQSSILKDLKENSTDFSRSLHNSIVGMYPQYQHGILVLDDSIHLAHRDDGAHTLWNSILADRPLADDSLRFVRWNGVVLS